MIVMCLIVVGIVVGHVTCESRDSHVTSCDVRVM